jgi:hypothetical protein
LFFQVFNGFDLLVHQLFLAQQGTGQFIECGILVHDACFQGLQASLYIIVCHVGAVSPGVPGSNRYLDGLRAVSGFLQGIIN